MADRHQAQAYPLRLPDELKQRVAAAATEAGRSLNAEIVHRLERSFEASGEVFPEAMKSFADELEERMQRAFAVEIAKVRAIQEQQALPGIAPAPDLFNQPSEGDAPPEAAPAAQPSRLRFARAKVK